MWSDEDIVSNLESKQEGSDVQKWLHGGLHGCPFRKQQSSVFWILRMEIFLIPNRYYEIVSRLYSVLPMLDIPCWVEAKLKIWLGEDSNTLIFYLFPAFKLIPFSLRNVNNQMWYPGLPLPLVFFSQFLQHFCITEHKSTTGQNLTVMLCIEMACFENWAYLFSVSCASSLRFVGLAWEEWHLPTAVDACCSSSSNFKADKAQGRSQLWRGHKIPSNSRRIVWVLVVIIFNTVITSKLCICQYCCNLFFC